MRNRNYLVKAAPKRPFMRLNEAAEYLGIAPRVLRVMAKAGDFPCQVRKNGESERLSYFFTQSALDNWLNGNGGEKQ